MKDGRMHYLDGKSIHLFQHLHTQHIYWQMPGYKDTCMARTMLQATCRLARVVALEAWGDDIAAIDDLRTKQVVKALLEHRSWDVLTAILQEIRQQQVDMITVLNRLIA